MVKNFLCVILICFGFSCSKQHNDVDSTPKILVSIAPYESFVKAIAGDTVDVEVLIPAGVNIHTYEPTPKQVERAIAAKAWFRIDELFEKRIVRALKEKNESMELVNLQDGLTLLPSHDAIALGEHVCHHHGAEDLHTWLSPRIVTIQVEKIYDTLVSLFPEHEAMYEKNYHVLVNSLDSLDTHIASILAPYSDSVILVSHPAFAYFCHEYDLKQLSVECEGKDPKPRDVEAIFLQAERYHPRVAILQLGFNNRGAELIAKKLDIRTLTFNPYSADYLQNMTRLAEAIAE